MDQVIDRIVRETSASFGLPPYWWKVDASRTSYIVKLPVKRWRINWVVEQTEAWEREHAFATIVGKCSTRWIARDEFCPKLNIGVGTHHLFSVKWRALPCDIRQMYLMLGGEEANNFRKAELTPWMLKNYGIFCQMPLPN
jgi:hypothetical protein